MASSSTQGKSFRHGLSVRLNRFRRKLQHRSDDANSTSSQGSRADPNIVYNNGGSLLSQQAGDVSMELTGTTDHEARTQTDQSALHANHPEQKSITRSTLGDGIVSITASSDLWSAAYREAVNSLGDDIDIAILKGESVARLFQELEEIDREATQESAFLRGVAYLHSIQVPLERFKLALDLASPLSNIDPTATTVCGVLRGVTAIAISFATADLEFAKQIGEMLEQISYIDDCDTLGQRANRTDIHKTLVCVYQKILEFYKVAHEILTRRGVKLMTKMILETDRLPNVVQDFLRHANTLQRIIQKATLEVADDIKNMLYDSEIARWLGGGKVALQSRYHADLQDLRNDEACEFLLTHPDFTKWYHASDSQWLTILGNMGCGKTVAMAFLVDELKRRNKYQLPMPKLCCYYCRDDGTEQAVHVFSVLILALLEQLPGLKKTFYDWYKQNQASGNLEPATDTGKLAEFLETVLETLDRPLFIIIDGLDECDRASRRALLKSLNSMSQKTPGLKIILSSRPEEEILKQLGRAVRIDLSSNSQRDAMIVRHTVERQLSHLSEDVRELVIKALSRSARGSAIWTKMTVELIELRRISALGPMQLFLEEMSLPEQLSDLYISMVARQSSNDPENKELVATALKILAVACRPLSIQELAWAVALAAAQQKVATVATLARLVDCQRVMSLIHPFITRVDFNDITKRQVRLVHQSMKEFIVREWPHLQDSATPRALDETNKYQQVETLEAFILDVCISYLLLDEIGSIHLFSEEQVAIDELPQEFDLFNDTGSFEYDRYCTWEAWEENMIHYDPNERGFGQFFVYAASHWLKHFDAVQSGSLPHLTEIENLCQAGSIRLHNWVKQNCRPDCAIKARFEFDSHLYDPLSITSLYGSDAMLHDMLENSNFDKDKFLPLSATSAADQILQWGDLSRLQILFLDDRLSHQLRNLDFFRLMVRRWSDCGARHGNWDVVFDLVDHMLDTLVQEQWGNELLCIAARAGCLPMIQRLLNRAQQRAELRTELLRGFQSVGEAVLGNHVDVAECLLEQEGFEAHLQYLNSSGENVLHLASRTCNPAIFHLLVPRLHGAIHQTDSQGDTALVRIVRSHSEPRDRYESARIILLPQADANCNSHFGAEQHDPLRVAIQLGDTDMCKLLICDGKMDPHSALTRDNNGQLVLKDKSWRNEEAVLQLLRTHADDAKVSKSYV